MAESSRHNKPTDTLKLFLILFIFLFGILMKPILWLISLFVSNNRTVYYHTIRKFIKPNDCCNKHYHEKFDTQFDFDILDKHLHVAFKNFGRIIPYDTKPKISFLNYSIGRIQNQEGNFIYQCKACLMLWELSIPENAFRGYFKPINVDLNSIKKYIEEDQTEFIWCLVGNIIDKHSSEDAREMKRGTKHFSSNTKVYCFPVQWGDGYKNIKVIGRHRKTSRNVCIVIPSKFITNWRLKKVFHPHILNVMQSQNGWTNSETDKEKILEMIKWLGDKQD